MVLLGLMVLALIIAAASKGCGGDSEEARPAAQSPTTTAPAAPDTAAAAEVVNQINTRITQAGGIQFVVGKTDLTQESRTVLNSVAALLKQNAAVKAEVRGFTDSQGDEQKNIQLSQQRAQVVVDYLVQQGIASDRLTAKGLGEATPVATNDTEEGRAKNRRVEFIPA